MKAFISFYVMLGGILLSELFLPYPYGIIGSIVILGLMPFLIKKLAFEIISLKSTSFVCLNCGAKHRKESCPKCGGKAKRLD